LRLKPSVASSRSDWLRKVSDDVTNEALLR
jgi:hypothetical protein